MRILPCFELSQIARAAEIEAFAFRELEHEPNGLDTVKNFRTTTEAFFKTYESRWIAISDGDVCALTDWAKRIRSIQTRLAAIDTQLAIAGSRLFSWDTVASAMGYLNAQRVAVEQTLNLNDCPFAAK